MLKKLIYILICFSSLTLSAQNIEIIGGLNKNTFHDFDKNQGHFISSYTSDYGYVVRLGIENLKVGWLTLRFTLSYDKYGGELDASDGGLGGGISTIAEIDKSVLSLGIFPLNFNIASKIDLNLGLEISRLLNETLNGTYSSWSIGLPERSYDLNDKYDRYSSLYCFGFRGRISYDFKLTDNIIVSPQYSYYFGLSNEFDEFPEITKSMKHYLCIGIQKNL